MLNLIISLRFLIKKPIQSLITLIVVIIGVAIFYFILNAGASLKALVLTTTAESNSHIFINDDFDFTSYDDEKVANFRNEVFKTDKRISDISYSYSLLGTINTLENKPVTVKGIDFIIGGEIQQILARIGSSEYNNVPSNDNFDIYFGEVVIGNGLASELGYESVEEGINTFITINLFGNNYLFKIVAIYPTEQVELSSKIVFTTIETTQKITNLKKANAIEIRVKDPLTSEKVLDNIKPVINNYYQDASYIQWQEGNRYAVNALYIEDVSIFIIQLFTAISISFGVAGLLIFTIKEKINQIGILKALGLNKSDTRLIFLYQTIIICVLGIIFGLFLGDMLAEIFTVLFRRPNSDAPLITLFVGLNNVYALTTALVMFFSCLIATYPAIRYAEKLKIIEIIKHE